MSKVEKLTSMEKDIHDKQKAIEKKAKQLFPEGSRIQFLKTPMKNPAPGRVQSVRWGWQGRLDFSVKNENTGKTRDISLGDICAGRG